MTTYGRLLRTMVSLKGAAADLRLLALHSPQKQVQERLTGAAARLEEMVLRLEERRRQMTAAEPQYRADGPPPHLGEGMPR